MRPVLYLALPCKVCAADAGEPCRRRDGELSAEPHPGRTPTAPCGTYGGYQRHRKSGEAACGECSEAARRYAAEYRKRRPDVRARDIAGLRARREAVRLLVERHRGEFDALLAALRAPGSVRGGEATTGPGTTVSTGGS